MLSPLLTNTVRQSRNQKSCENAELHLMCTPFGTGNTYKKPYRCHLSFSTALSSRLTNITLLGSYRAVFTKYKALDTEFMLSIILIP